MREQQIYRSLLRYFRGNKSQADEQGVVLVQLHSNPKLQVGAVFFSEAASREFGAGVMVFYPRLDEKSFFKSILDRTLDFWSIRFGRGSFGPYGLLRPRGIIRFRWQSASRRSAEYRQLLNSIGSLRDLENLSFRGVHIGDLLYDEYLMRSREPTIDTNTANFEIFFLQSLQLLDDWIDFFDRYEVKAVISSAPYLQGLPLRVAITRGIGAFEVFPESHETRSFSRTLPYSRMESIHFRDYFRELTPEVQESALALANERLGKRFSGEKDPHLKNTLQWSKRDNTSNDDAGEATVSRKRVLVATHDFLDSPHIFSVGIFPDFFEWLVALGEMTRHSKYEWLIKVHPDSGQVSEKACREIVGRYPQFSFLNREVSNLQLISQGLTAVFTCYGTVGIEFPHFGIPVVNCDPNNPHRAYSFNYHPQNQEEIRHLIENLDSLRVEAKGEEMLECFYMQNLSNWFSYFYDFQSQPADVWRHVSQTITTNSFDQVIDGFSKFIRSGDYWFQWSKYGQTTSMNT